MKSSLSAKRRTALMMKTKSKHKCKSCGQVRDTSEFGSDYPDTCGRCVARQVMGRD
jgi:hypothetical protein